MPSVIVDLKGLANPASGVGVFCHQLALHLSQLELDGLELHFLLPASHVGRYGRKINYHKDGRIIRLRFRMGHCFELWHSTFQRLPAPGKGIVVQTVHDLMGYKKQGDKLLEFQRYLDRCQAVCFVSDYVRRQAQELMRLPMRLEVIPNGVAEITAPSRCPDFLGASPFFLSIGEFRPRKRLELLIETLALLKGFNLVLAGNLDCYPVYTSSLKKLARKHGLQERVFFSGVVSESEKRYLLENCEALLFCSVDEGFGIPAIEGQAVGKPTFLSSCGSLPEVGGKEAFYWSSESPGVMHEELMTGLSTFDSKRGERSRKWAEKFCWKKTAKTYLQLYRELLFK